jgi:hypothetical protein
MKRWIWAAAVLGLILAARHGVGAGAQDAPIGQRDQFGRTESRLDIEFLRAPIVYEQPITIINECDDNQSVLIASDMRTEGIRSIRVGAHDTTTTIVRIRTADAKARMAFSIAAVHPSSVGLDGTSVCERAENRYSADVAVGHDPGDVKPEPQYFTLPAVALTLTQRKVRQEPKPPVDPPSTNPPPTTPEEPDPGLLIGRTYSGPGSDNPEDDDYWERRPPIKLPIKDFDTLQPFSAPEQSLDGDSDEVMDDFAPLRLFRQLAGLLIVRLEAAARFDSRDVTVSFVATGQASGDTIRPRIQNRSGRRVRIVVPDGLVLRPTGAMTQPPADTPNAASVTGYCAEFARKPPPAGAIYEMAPAAMQKRYGSLRSVLKAARDATESGPLQGGDRASYVHSLTQWSSWTKLEQWSEKDFSKHFIDKAKENLGRAGQKWTKDIEKAIGGDVPKRWTDIRGVLDRATAIEQRLKLRGNR